MYSHICGFMKEYVCLLKYLLSELLTIKNRQQRSNIFFLNDQDPVAKNLIASTPNGSLSIQEFGRITLVTNPYLAISDMLIGNIDIF